ncbi:hypothetical protein [Simiduia curdlanivorans]|uniref:hypothetical protein n=1 Tax=Simiduia curdlanivorans TaxID=1492769 RepID=UPI00338FE762
MLLRFYDPQSGSTFDWPTPTYPAHTQCTAQTHGVGAQQPALFTADVRYNIAYGNPDACEAEKFSLPAKPPTPTSSSPSCPMAMAAT